MADPATATTPTTRSSPSRPSHRTGARPADEPTETGRLQTVDAAVAREQGDRGSLEVADKVLVKIAQRAALEVAGVAPAGAATGRLGGMLGRGYPDADVEHAGTRASVTLEIATTWPHPAPQVAAGVRESVTRRLRELAAVDADAVAVHVAAVVQAPPAPAPERVR